MRMVGGMVVGEDGCQKDDCRRVRMVVGEDGCG